MTQSNHPSKGPLVYKQRWVRICPPGPPEDAGVTYHVTLKSCRLLIQREASRLATTMSDEERREPSGEPEPCYVKPDFYKKLLQAETESVRGG